MSTLKKSNLLILLIILAILLFISALIWKQFSVDNSETITTKLIPEVTLKNPDTKKVKQPITKTSEVLQNQIVQVEEESDQTNRKEVPLDIKVKRAKLERKLNMHLMLTTPEGVMDTITALQKQGKDELANEYLDYLLEKFPDFKIE